LGSTFSVIFPTLWQSENRISALELWTCFCQLEILNCPGALFYIFNRLLHTGSVFPLCKHFCHLCKLSKYWRHTSTDIETICIYYELCFSKVTNFAFRKLPIIMSKSAKILQKWNIDPRFFFNPTIIRYFEKIRRVTSAKRMVAG
jgi:hypothetical protein